MDSIAQEILAIRDRTKSAPRAPREFMYPAHLVKHAAEMFKNEDWYINGSDGSRFYHGELVKAPHVSVDVARMNERIAAMELPTCVKRLQVFPPEDRKVYLLGDWNIAEDGENHEIHNRQPERQPAERPQPIFY